MANLTFNHPFWEIWQVMFPGIPYPKDYTEYLEAQRTNRVFRWCACSEVAFGDFDPPSKSTFLNALASGLQQVDCNAVVKRFPYIRAAKPLGDYEEDDYVQRCIDHLANPGDQTIFQFIQTLGLSLPFQYLLLNYLDNAGHMDHGTSLRVGYRSDRHDDGPGNPADETIKDGSITPRCTGTTAAPAGPRYPRPTSP